MHNAGNVEKSWIDSRDRRSYNQRRRGKWVFLPDENLENDDIQTSDNESRGENIVNRIKIPIPAEFGGGYATGATMAEAVKHAIERAGVIPAAKGTAQDDTSPLFGDYFQTWISLKEGSGKAETTIAGYKGIAQAHLIPFFGDMRIAEIKPDNIQAYFNGIRNNSKSMSIQSKAILSGMFDNATRNDIIEKNPMRFKYDISSKQGKKTVLQDEDLFSFIAGLDSLKGAYMNDFYYACFLAFTGLRKSEILGLKWKDLDSSGNVLHVRQAVKYPNGQNEPVIGLPKDDSTGTNFYPTMLAERIEQYRGEPNNYVVGYSAEEPNKPITKSMFDKMWRRITNKIDVKGATSHSFRATCPTMINAHCESADTKVLQGVLRHKTPDLAIKVYTKENDSKTRKAEMEYDSFLREQMSQYLEHGAEAATA